MTTRCKYYARCRCIFYFSILEKCLSLHWFSSTSVTNQALRFVLLYARFDWDALANALKSPRFATALISMTAVYALAHRRSNRKNIFNRRNQREKRKDRKPLDETFVYFLVSFFFSSFSSFLSLLSFFFSYAITFKNCRIRQWMEYNITTRR